MAQVLLSLGSNLGDRMFNLKTAVKEIEKKIGTIVSMSSIYESEAWGFKSEDNFLNQVVEVNSVIGPIDVMKMLLGIEGEMGRIRKSGEYESRPIDLDILFYDNVVSDTQFLQLPHPRLHERKFMLIPLNEMNPNLIHPVFQKSVHQLLNECPDNLWVKKYAS